jgi:glutathione peroxidase
MLNRITNRFSAGLSLSIVGAIALVTGFACAQAAPQTAALTTKWKDATLHEIKVKTLDGKDANLAEYAGKVTLVVNVASQCGFTSQYAGLQKVYDKYKDRGLVILAFPSGDFGGQEFNDPKEIKEFCSTKYSVTFPIFEKCKVKSGAEQSKVFECLGTKTGELPGWNFGKYVVSRDGKTAQFFASTVAPESARMIEAIEKALAEKTSNEKPSAEKTSAEKAVPVAPTANK